MIEAFEEWILEASRSIYEAIGWPGVVFLMAVESACIPFPSEVIMPLAGWFLVKEKGLGFEWLLVAGLLGAIGNLLGSWVAYAVGRKVGRAFVERYGHLLLISQREVAMADRFFARYGEGAVFFSRLLPVVRTFISFPAGVANMPLARFCALTLVGSYPWSLGLAGGGYILGEHWDRITNVFRPVAIPLAVGLGLAIAWYYGHRILALWRAGKRVEAKEE